MWRVLQVFVRYGNVLLFIFLELIALVLIINLNKEHNQISQRFFLQISSGINDANTRVRDYFALGQENRKLMEENRLLMQQVESLEQEISIFKNKIPYQPGFFNLPDSLLPIQGYDFIPARTINNTVDKNYNYITLDKGRMHGVENGMGVLSPDGIAGMVIETSKRYALAISVLNKKFNLSAKLVHNQNIGPITWDGRDADYGYLQDIPRTSEIIIGDTVVTSGYSVIFPAGMLVGVVESYNADAKVGFYTVKVRLSTNFRGLGNVYIVKHEYAAEIDSLEQKGTGE